MTENLARFKNPLSSTHTDLIMTNSIRAFQNTSAIGT